MAREIKNWLIIVLAILIIVLLFIRNCENKNKKSVTTTKKEGKTKTVKHTSAITFDTLKWIASYKANTKPVIKWKKPKNDTVLIEQKPLYSPCDSIFASSDSGFIQGIKYSIVDTISDNRVIGRSIALNVPESIITKNVVDSVKQLRVDTVYVPTKQKFGTNAKWFLKGFAVGNITGFIGGSFLIK